MNSQEIVLGGIAAAPMIVALVELAKLYIPTKYAPLVALALGIAAGVAAQATVPNPIWINGLVMGVAEGLSASGLYSGIAKLTEDPASAPTPPAAPASK